MTRHRVVLTVGLGLYAAVMSFLGGVLVERIRFDAQRSAVLTRVSAVEQRLQAYLMALEKQERER